MVQAFQIWLSLAPRVIAAPPARIGGAELKVLSDEGYDRLDNMRYSLVMDTLSVLHLSEWEKLAPESLVFYRLCRTKVPAAAS